MYSTALFEGLYTKDPFFNETTKNNFPRVAIIMYINKHLMIHIHKKLDISINKDFFIDILALKTIKKRVILKVSSTVEDNNRIKEKTE